MKTQVLMLSAALALMLPIASAHGATGPGFVRFHDVAVGGSAGQVSLAGGGNYDAASGFVRMNGHFRCDSDVVQGPLSGLRAGEGVRWEAIELLPSSGFKCSGDAGELLKTVFTDDDTVVMSVAFFRQGDGNTPSFTAKVFVSAADEGTDLPGTQNIWIQGVGCGEADIR